MCKQCWDAAAARSMANGKPQVENYNDLLKENTHKSVEHNQAEGERKVRERFRMKEEEK